MQHSKLQKWLRESFGEVFESEEGFMIQVADTIGLLVIPLIDPDDIDVIGLFSVIAKAPKTKALRDYLSEYNRHDMIFGHFDAIDDGDGYMVTFEYHFPTGSLAKEDFLWVLKSVVRHLVIVSGAVVNLFGGKMYLETLEEEGVEQDFEILN